MRGDGKQKAQRATGGCLRALDPNRPTIAHVLVRALGASLPDRRLHQRLLGGEPLALAEAHAEFHTLVLGLAKRVTRNHQTAEEVTQEVFLALWRRPECFDPERGSMRAWLSTVARRRAIDALRVEEADRRRVDKQACQRLEPADDIGSTVVAQLSTEQVLAAVNSLDEDRRLPILLAYFHGHTYCQVAKHLGVAEGTIKSRIRAGLRDLADSVPSQTTEQAC